jgi:hypothetical protein
VIASARGFQRFALTRDDELDAALILLGAVDVPPGRRYCFQTTYLNENYNEYGMLGPGQKLIWVLRNPYSVVYSMVYHWRRAALRRLYEGCAIQEQTSARLRRSRWPWPLGPSELEKACLAYSAKTSQVEVIRQIVPAGHLMVIEYDSMIQAPEDSLGKVFGFIEEPFDAAYAAALHSGSVRKADRLPHRARRLIQMHCEPVYKRCLTLLTQPASAS